MSLAYRVRAAKAKKSRSRLNDTPPATGPVEPSLSVEALSYRYGSRQALSEVSFSVAGASFCALLGPNGAGKSTLFSLLTRLFVSRQGRITVAGHNLGTEPRAALARIGVVFQAQTLDLDLSVRRNLRYFAALHGLTRATTETRIDEALDRLDMRERAHERARDLNGGHRRRMEIARALIHRPAVLLLDEPTVGLDAPSRKAITDYVHDLTDEGLAVLWATHLVDEVRDTDRLVMLHQGRIVADGIAGDIAPGGTLAETFTTMTASEK